MTPIRTRLCGYVDDDHALRQLLETGPVATVQALMTLPFRTLGTTARHATRVTVITWVVALTTLTAVACTTPRPISFDAQWPNAAPNYDVATKGWTRGGTLRGDLSSGFEQILDIRATFHAPEWRAALINRRGKLERLSSAKRSQLAIQQKQALTQFHEFTVRVSTHSFRENDLHRQDKSTWRVALVDSSLQEIGPVSIRRDRRPLPVLRALYPDTLDFDQTYVIRFPAANMDLYGGEGFALILGGTRGSVLLKWKPPTGGK